ncbi:MAG TPA: tetratricopeptide repeat protein, partial [Methylibium sp.]|uniref:tetratricopeptide repeat protein n=1 Tax=Methylibium sp. TaxID=2067992 RepID=UPI002DB74BA0
DPRRLLVGIALALASALSGCASGGLREMVGMAPAAVTNPQDAKPAAAKPSVEAPVAAKPAEAPVAANVQRAYDDARRLLAAGRSAEAERAFKALAQAHPELGGPQANLGLIYRQTGRGAEAVAALEKAVEASPGQPVFFNQLGVAYREAGEFQKARGAYEQALELEPDYASAALNLGILHDLYLADAAQALALYDRYQQLTGGKDAQVGKWVADLKNRSKPAPGAPAGKPVALVKKEQP